MKSLSYLNNYCSTFQITYLDQRDASVIFDKNSANDQVIVVNEGKDHIIPLGIDIVDIIQGSTLNIEWTIDLSNLSSPDITWTVPVGCSIVHTPGSKIWKLTGITTKEQWEIAKYPTIISRYSGFGEFVYDADITYTPSGSKSWSINLTLQEGLFFDSEFVMSSSANIIKSSTQPLSMDSIFTANGKYVLKGAGNLSVDSTIYSKWTNTKRSTNNILSVDSTISLSAKLATRSSAALLVNSSLSMTGKLAIRVFNTILSIDTTMNTSYTWPLPNFEIDSSSLISYMGLQLYPYRRKSSSATLPNNIGISISPNVYLGIKVFSAGLNNSAQLGVGDTTNRNIFTKVLKSDSPTSVISISAGNTLSGFVKSNTAYFFGNVVGTITSTPSSVTGSYTSIAIGYDHVLMIRTDDVIRSFGYNSSGQLANGTTTTSTTPTATSFTNAAFLSDHKIRAGKYFSMLHRNSGLFFSGLNSSGQHGLGNTTNSTSWTYCSWSLEKTISDISCGEAHSLVLLSSGLLYTVGNNTYGQLGRASGVNQSTFDSTMSSVLKIGCTASSNTTIVIKDNHTLWGFGRNDSYQLGLGDTTNRLTPVQIGTDTDWYEVSCGATHTLAKKMDGSIWIWGTNTYGQLGTGNSTTITTPTQLQGDFPRNSTISAGNNFSLIRT